MKAHGKGRGIDIALDGSLGGTSKVNEWKQQFRNLSDDLPKREWKPLKSWPARPHPEQPRIEEFHAIKSRFL